MPSAACFEYCKERRSARASTTSVCPRTRGITEALGQPGPCCCARIVMPFTYSSQHPAQASQQLNQRSGHRRHASLSTNPPPAGRAGHVPRHQRGRVVDGGKAPVSRASEGSCCIIVDDQCSAALSVGNMGAGIMRCHCTVGREEFRKKSGR